MLLLTEWPLPLTVLYVLFRNRLQRPGWYYEQHCEVCVSLLSEVQVTLGQAKLVCHSPPLSFVAPELRALSQSGCPWADLDDCKVAVESVCAVMWAKGG